MSGPNWQAADLEALFCGQGAAAPDIPVSCCKSLNLPQKLSVRLAAELPPAAAYHFLRLSAQGACTETKPQIPAIPLGPVIIIPPQSDHFKFGGAMQTALKGPANGLNSPTAEEKINFCAPIEPALAKFPLVVVLGEAELTAHQILALDTGAIFEFSLDSESPLRLVLAGETVARGKLVRRGQQTAVEVTEIAGTEQKNPFAPASPVNGCAGPLDNPSSGS